MIGITFDSPNRYKSLAQYLNAQRATYGGRNALTAVERFGDTTTNYLLQNEGYAQIVGVQFDNKGKVYDYINPSGASRTGDSPTAEVTNKYTGRNSFVPPKHTNIVRTRKGGIGKNEYLLDKITNKGINLKIIGNQRQLNSANREQMLADVLMRRYNA